MKALRQTYWFFLGVYQMAPRWLDRLPRFFQPIYIGNDEFRWLHCVIKVRYPIGGETLFMAWRRHLRHWANRIRWSWIDRYPRLCSRFRPYIILDNDGRAPTPPGFVEVDLPYDEGGLAKPWHIDPVLINAMTPEKGLFGDYDPDPLLVADVDG